jgi:DNA-binding NarL/FixJ family response regulator
MSRKSTSNSKKLLVVDDDPNLILLVKDYLEFKGYQVLTADNGRKALQIVQQEESLDMIICDIMMPEMDGYAFVEELRHEPSTKWIPVMVLSAKGQSPDRIKGLNIGADVYMVKPFEPEELLAQVNSTLRQVKRLMAHNIKKADGLPKIEVPNNFELTPTETKVVTLVAQGMGNRDIAESLNVSQRTIESHVSNMLNKTGLNNRTELARWFMQTNTG